jgi:hypothetical protein
VWLPVDGGDAAPAAGDAGVALTGSLRLTAAGSTAGDLTLDGLRLELDGGSGTLSARAGLDGTSRRLALAEVRRGPSAPAVRGAGATWTGLRLSLTADGAALFASWTGQTYEKGGELAPLDVTVGLRADGRGGDGQEDTGDSAGGGAGGDVADESSAPATPEPKPGKENAGPALSAGVAHPNVGAGGEQRVTGEGFAPGEVVLVAIDDDTRYDVVADDSGRVSRTFPVYATAAEGTHTVELRTVSGEQGPVAVEFAVRGS